MYSRKNNTQRARDVMRKKVVYIDGMATAKEAVDLMRAEKVDTLIVKKRHEDDAFGIVELQDLINGVIIPDRNSSEVNVYEIMKKPAISVPSSMDIRYVANFLIRTQIRRAPVEENGEYVGMISISSLILHNMEF
ncbi:MAG: CBS domain-containing protein [Cyclobacteriaceae bacterium]|nr:CBS domain-containing protein [Cyclobacteriaceae bacterium]